MKRARRHAPEALKQPVRADLHVHTSHSDGACSPGDVVRAAASVGVAAVAITDHDTLSALAVARPEASRLGVELVGGIELTAEFQGREIHILGHFVRDDSPALVAATTALRAARADRLRAMTDRLAQLGLWIDLVALERAFPRATLGRRHLADWLVKTEQVTDRREAFRLYLGDDGPAHVPKPRLPWDEAIALIRSAGGVAGLAHPGPACNTRLLRALAAGGLGSIEVDGPGVGRPLGRRLRDWATEFELVPTAGTDFHAPDRPGRWVGSITTPAADFERLRTLAGTATAAGGDSERPLCSAASSATNTDRDEHASSNSPMVATWR